MPIEGRANITNDPGFVDFEGGDFHLTTNSACINAGHSAYTPSGGDSDGLPRLVGGTIDIGAYEFQTPCSRISYAWLQQYGLPIDCSVDNADPDGDQMSNWNEWRSGTDPTNALSALRLLRPMATASGFDVSWLSVTDRIYFLERSTNLGTAPAFLPWRTNVFGQVETTTVRDPDAGIGAVLYRVGVTDRLP